MLIYKQRYKPRTTREFTKSDLTVYDSADNTALNALTVYGKSEVVDGAIVSAGEGWATVDLGTLTWGRQVNVSEGWAAFYATATGIVVPQTAADRLKGILCPIYPISTQAGYRGMENKSIMRNNGYIIIKDDDYTDTTTFTSAMTDIMLAYELADPAQGNCIAVKTDNGTGIDGTMATFTTGTPLRGIPDTTVRDVMTWDGVSGEATKNCGELDLGALNYVIPTGYTNMFIANIPTAKFINNQTYNALCSEYACNTAQGWQSISDKEFSIGAAIRAANTPAIAIKDTGYNDATAFKSAMSGVKLVYPLKTPTTQNLTTTENNSIAGLRTFASQTHAQNNAQTEMTVDYTIKVPTI